MAKHKILEPSHGLKSSHHGYKMVRTRIISNPSCYNPRMSQSQLHINVQTLESRHKHSLEFTEQKVVCNSFLSPDTCRASILPKLHLPDSSYAFVVCIRKLESAGIRVLRMLTALKGRRSTLGCSRPQTISDEVFMVGKSFSNDP